MPTSHAKSQSSTEEQNDNNSTNQQTSKANLSASSCDMKQPAVEKQAEKRGSARSSLSSNNSDEMRLLSTNADYDRIRNITLMFFLDRLYIASQDGKEARTLHDLSCLFGTKDFTKEMRQIVGASRNGLKKFLQSYPSLFTIDGDKVYLTELKQDSTSSGSARDYNKEAVEYFTQKLLQFGASLVPIKNLFGYRSQASQEVRHVSGKNTKEFKQFLSAHEDVFEILADEHVVLKSALQELESRGESHTTLQCSLPNEEVVMDPYLNKQFAHSIEDCMKKLKLNNDDNESNDNNRVTIEYLHAKIMQDCNNQLFLKMVKTIEDLKVFLRMHPKIFKRFKCDEDQHDYVCLLTAEERKEMEIQAYPSLLTARHHSNLKRSETNESNLSDSSSNHQPISLPPNPTSQLLSHEADQQPISMTINVEPQHQASNKSPLATTTKVNDDIHHTRTSSSLSATTTTTTTTGSSETKTTCASSATNTSTSHRAYKTGSIHNNNNSIHGSTDTLNNGHSSLRATAPPFVPSNHCQPKSLQIVNGSGGRNQSSRQQVSTSREPIQRSVSNLNQTTTNNHLQHHHQQQTSREHPTQRGIIDPRHALRSYLIKASVGNNIGNNGLYSPSKQSNGAQFQQQKQQQQSHLLRQNSSGGDDLRARTVNIVREASNIITRIMTSTDAVAFDCKGYNLGFNGQITLIQFGFLPKLNPASGTHPLLDNSNILNGNTNNNNRQPDGKQKPEVCIFDLITNPELAYCLKPLLESDQIIKIVHDVRNKSNALHNQFNIMLNHVFDTQVANLVIQQQETGKPAYKSRYISMSKLCEIYGDESLTKYRNLIKSKTRHSSGNNNSQNKNNSSSTNKIKDVNYWKARPLTDAMVYESTMDVYCLVGGVYQNLKSKIKPEYKPLFEQLNLEGVLARIKPDEIRSVKKERKIDLEVIDLKRKLYSDSTSSIVLSNREIRLLRHIDLTEEVREKIQQCKKVAKKLERLDMKAAQNAQGLLQSMNSQVSSSNEDQSLDPNASVQTNDSSCLSSSLCHSLGNDEKVLTTTTIEQQQTGNEKDRDQHLVDGGENNDDLGETGMTDLMDSSMFDELKNKIDLIESASLLESLDDDDDEVGGEQGVGKGGHGHLEHSGSHDNCRCLCHRGSTGGGDNTNLSLKSSSSSTSTSSTDKDNASVESRAVDMAVQCDLLS